VTVFNTNRRPALIVGIVAIALCVTGIAIAASLAMTLPISLITHALTTVAVALLIVIVWLVYNTFSLASISYLLDRNAFIIHWGLIREIVPMGDVQRVIAASDVASELKFRGLRLTNWWIGNGYHPALGEVRFCSNSPLRNQLIIVTPEMNYAISPADRDGFIDAFRMRFDMGPTQVVQPARLMPRIMHWPFWTDRLAHTLVLIAVGLNLVLFAVGFARYPQLPQQLVLHFDSAGVADRFGPPNQVFGPAVISLELIIINFLIALGVYSRGEKLAAYLAWGGNAIVQLFFLIATITVAFSG
jgi:hypothetical protein